MSIFNRADDFNYILFAQSSNELKGFINPHETYRHVLFDKNENLKYFANGKESIFKHSLNVKYANKKDFAVIKELPKIKDINGKKHMAFSLESDIGSFRMIVDKSLINTSWLFEPSGWIISRKNIGVYQIIDNNNVVRAKICETLSTTKISFKNKQDEKYIALFYFAVVAYNDKGIHFIYN